MHPSAAPRQACLGLHTHSYTQAVHLHRGLPGAPQGLVYVHTYPLPWGTGSCTPGLPCLHTNPHPTADPVSCTSEHPLGLGLQPLATLAGHCLSFPKARPMVWGGQVLAFYRPPEAQASWPDFLDSALPSRAQVPPGSHSGPASQYLSALLAELRTLSQAQAQVTGDVVEGRGAPPGLGLPIQALGTWPQPLLVAADSLPVSSPEHAV